MAWNNQIEVEAQKFFNQFQRGLIVPPSVKGVMIPTNGSQISIGGNKETFTRIGAAFKKREGEEIGYTDAQLEDVINISVILKELQNSTFLNNLLFRTFTLALAGGAIYINGYIIPDPVFSLMRFVGKIIPAMLIWFFSSGYTVSSTLLTGVILGSANRQILYGLSGEAFKIVCEWYGNFVYSTTVNYVNQRMNYTSGPRAAEEARRLMLNDMQIFNTAQKIYLDTQTKTITRMTEAANKMEQEIVSTNAVLAEFIKAEKKLNENKVIIFTDALSEAPPAPGAPSDAPPMDVLLQSIIEDAEEVVNEINVNEPAPPEVVEDAEEEVAVRNADYKTWGGLVDILLAQGHSLTENVGRLVRTTAQSVGEAGVDVVLNASRNVYNAPRVPSDAARSVASVASNAFAYFRNRRGGISKRKRRNKKRRSIKKKYI